MGEWIQTYSKMTTCCGDMGGRPSAFPFLIINSLMISTAGACGRMSAGKVAPSRAGFAGRIGGMTPAPPLSGIDFVRIILYPVKLEGANHDNLYPARNSRRMRLELSTP